MEDNRNERCLEIAKFGCNSNYISQDENLVESRKLWNKARELQDIAVKIKNDAERQDYINMLNAARCSTKAAYMFQLPHKQKRAYEELNKRLDNIKEAIDAILSEEQSVEMVGTAVEPAADEQN